MVPEGNALFVRAPHPFRMTLRDSGKTLAAEAAVRFGDGQWGVLLPVAPCRDTGGGAERRTLDMTVYAPQGIQRSSAALLVLPPAGLARIATRLTGEEVRASDGRLHAVLSNGAGAMAHLRVAWGEIRSQYDCILAVNPHPAVPVDKMIFWTRCRAWLNWQGYSSEVNASCLERFEVDPVGDSAEWRFAVPCGMGQSVPLTFRVEMARGLNRASLVIRRGGDAPEPVTVILRPDIEWRNFHQTTKASGAIEKAWPAATTLTARGFVFAPAEGEALSIETAYGTYRRQPEWLHGVPHPEEQERGLDPTGDLYSPGWFEIPLAGGQEVTLTASRNDNWDADETPCPAAPASASSASSFAAAVSQALSLYVVRRDNLHTVIAGYPWFLDWGRDTLIALRGLIADGQHGLALDILSEFGRFERNGTLPNMIRGEDDANRETSDAPLWFCVATGELMAALGDAAVLDTPCGGRALREVLVSILTHYRDGTPNGIRMDASSGLIYSPAHYTWMDTNYPAATPRQGYPVEIQALWIQALRLAAQKIDASWNALAEQAADALARYFTTPEGWLADCLRATAGVPAQDAAQEDALRPNQLLAVTLGALRNREADKAILRACECLLVPGAIRSLADRPVKADMPVVRDGVLLNDPHRPYQGRYAGDEDTRRKPAYHNGTAWTWQFPLYVEALVKVYGAEARDAGLSLLGSSTELINQSCLCHTPEICDGDAPHTPRGCGAQAWGMSELLRVWEKITRN
jgi:predicted glycogen debranching enzyme